MIHFNFISSNNFNINHLKTIESFGDHYPDFQTISLNNENELLELLQLMGISKFEIHQLSDSEFSEYWDISDFLLPEFSEEQFENFYFNWLQISKRENNMDEYGNLIFLRGLCSKWNKMQHRIVLKEKP